MFLLRGWVPRIYGRTEDLFSVQSSHTRLTPRVGGVGIFAAISLSVFFAPISISGAYVNFFLAMTVLFSVGLAEDLGFKISPRWRMFAAMGASLLVIWLLGVWIPRIGIPGFDMLVGHWAVGIPLTLLLTAGIANGFNLIDGVNGLASMTGIVAAIALSQIAELAGYVEVGHLAMLMAAGIFGFFLMNYPLGLIFLGDAGAYTIGFVLSWFGIAILLNAPVVSPWAILLTMYWPVADTLLAIYRRAQRNVDISAPDRLHVHQMVMRALEICILGRNRRHIANPLTTLVLSPFVIAPPLAGVLLWNQNMNAFLTFLIFSMLFFASYAAAPGLIRRFRQKFTKTYPLPISNKI